ncbi:MAG: ATP-binding protein [Pyrinomonadaceae bacterium]|nr:ATP-binding protein [Pyrinomonadaceae bacterium]
MFLSIDRIKEAVENLNSVHPFYGLTFLACKKNRLPVGEAVPFPISTYETELLDEYYRPDKGAEYFYQVFRTSVKKDRWVPRKKYASSTLQSTRTQSVFRNAFLHDSGSDSWGWKENYIEILSANLSQNIPPYRDMPVPAFYLAVWLYREREWDEDTTAQDIVDAFRSEFLLDHLEVVLFDFSIPASLLPAPLFEDKPVSWEDLRGFLGSPPDAKPEEGGTLALLETQGVGPYRSLTFAPAERLNLITGDNGLGKSFLLECSWWALTGQWNDSHAEAYPREIDAKPKITFEIAGSNKSEKITVSYDWSTQSWPSPKKRPTIPGLVVYARVDGSFAIWDPARNRPLLSNDKPSPRYQRPIVVTRSQVWGGHEGTIEGLVRDWVTWQSRPEKHPFEIFRKVLAKLSPPDLGPLEPGEPRRLPGEPKEVPTLRHPYGEIPIVHASAGVRRIVTLAYLIVWAWNEHKVHSELARAEPQKRMVIMIDEMEAHLHPLWQRSVLPALMEVGTELSRDLQPQILVATHSPLVMASIESGFDESKDKLFHLDLSQDGEVAFQELRFVRYGSIDAWLTSEVFDLRHARSLEGERAIENARAVQSLKQPTSEDIEAVHAQLAKSLASDDEFWPPWLYFAEQHGVKL